MSHSCLLLQPLWKPRCLPARSLDEQLPARRPRTSLLLGCAWGEKRFASFPLLTPRYYWCLCTTITEWQLDCACRLSAGTAQPRPHPRNHCWADDSVTGFKRAWGSAPTASARTVNSRARVVSRVLRLELLEFRLQEQFTRTAVPIHLFSLGLLRIFLRLSQRMSEC